MKSDIRIVDGEHLAFVEEISAAELQAHKDRAEALRNGRHIGQDDMRLAATVPGFVIADWCNKRGIGFDEFMRNPKLAESFLNDPDNKAFRVWEGRV